MNEQPTLEELHADDVARGAVHVNEQVWPGRYVVLVPDPSVVNRWGTIATFRSKRQAEAFAAGYCARRDFHLIGTGRTAWPGATL